MKSLRRFTRKKKQMPCHIFVHYVTKEVDREG